MNIYVHEKVLHKRIGFENEIRGLDTQVDG